MAKKVKKRATKRETLPGESRQIRVTMDVPEDVPTYFVNYAEVNFGPSEITISAMRVPARFNSSKLREAVEDGTIAAQAEVQLVLPPSVAVALTNALTMQKENYEKQFGPIPVFGASDE
jgi:hypothetical protein